MDNSAEHQPRAVNLERDWKKLHLRARDEAYARFKESEKTREIGRLLHEYPQLEPRLHRLFNDAYTAHRAVKNQLNLEIEFQVEALELWHAIARTGAYGGSDQKAISVADEIVAAIKANVAELLPSKRQLWYENEHSHARADHTYDLDDGEPMPGHLTGRNAKGADVGNGELACYDHVRYITREGRRIDKRYAPFFAQIGSEGKADQMFQMVMAYAGVTKRSPSRMFATAAAEIERLLSEEMRDSEFDSVVSLHQWMMKQATRSGAHKLENVQAEIEAHKKYPKGFSPALTYYLLKAQAHAASYAIYEVALELGPRTLRDLPLPERDALRERVQQALIRNIVPVEMVTVKLNRAGLIDVSDLKLLYRHGQDIGERIADEFIALSGTAHYRYDAGREQSRGIA